MRLIFVKHPQAAKNYAEHVQSRWPGEELVLICTVPNGLNQPFFPRGIAYSKYPVVRATDYRANKNWLMRNGDFTSIIRVTEGAEIKSESVSFDGAAKLLTEAAELTFLGDWDYTGVWGMEMLQRHLNPTADPRPHQVIRNPYGYVKEHLDIAFLAPKDSSDREYQELLNAGFVKRYFDYNFALNSFAILGNLYREVFEVKDPVFIGRNSLLIMQHASYEPKLPYNLKRYLEDWKGTGKYASGTGRFFEGLGTSLSCQMVEHDLKMLGIMATSPDGVGTSWSLTDLGKQFVARLHKDCYDPDQSFRLSAWMERPFGEAKVAIDQYLMTFFRKQKRHQGV